MRGGVGLKGGHVFTLSDIAGIKFWLRADSQVYKDAGTTLAVNNDTVQQWNDQSGAGNNAVQSTSGQRPTFLTANVNGLPAIQFAQSSATSLNLSANPLNGASAGTGFEVVKLVRDPPILPNANDTGEPFGNWGSQTTGFPNSHFPYTDSTIYNGWGSSARKTVGNPTPALTSWRVIAIVSASADWRYYIDGGAAPFFSTGTNTVGFTNVPKVGKSDIADGSAGLPYCMNGWIAEMVAYNSKLSLTDLNRVGSYLATKYGTTWTTVTS